MIILKDEKLERITGGDAGLFLYVITTSIIIFISGIISGYTNPTSCKESK